LRIKKDIRKKKITAYFSLYNNNYYILNNGASLHFNGHLTMFSPSESAMFLTSTQKHSCICRRNLLVWRGSELYVITSLMFPSLDPALPSIGNTTPHSQFQSHTVSCLLPDSVLCCQTAASQLALGLYSKMQVIKYCDSYVK